MKRALIQAVESLGSNPVAGAKYKRFMKAECFYFVMLASITKITNTLLKNYE